MSVSTGVALCDHCGEPLRIDPDRGVRVIHFQHLDEFVRAMEGVDPEVAAELNLSKGFLNLHTDCEHPVEQYLPDPDLLDDNTPSGSGDR